MNLPTFLLKRMYVLAGALSLAGFALVPPVWAVSTTATTLVVSSAGRTVNTVLSGSVVELTATVTSSGASLTTGQVKLCDASAAYCTDLHLLGTAQLTSAGTAVFKLFPGLGSHSYKAVFTGTPGGSPAYSGSSSGTAALTVTGASPTSTAIAQSGSVGNYTLTATVTGLGNASNPGAPAGTVSFLDMTGGNLSLGTALLGAGAAKLGFLNSSSPATNPYPQSVAVADFNGDGKPDLAVPVYSIGTSLSAVSVLLGNGDGTFAAGPVVPAIGLNAGSVVAGDFNGDGHADIAITLPDNSSIMVLLGKGDGTFTQKGTIADPAVPTFVAAGDFNGDGRADLVVANEGGLDLTILLGNGDGTFAAGSNVATSDEPVAVAVGDFNGDGNLDVATVIFPYQAGVLGSGTDVPGSVQIFLGKGDGTFTPVAASPSTGLTAVSIAAADFNADGILDLAVANTYVDTSGPGTVTVLLGKGNGTFTAAASPLTGILPQSVAAVDLNGDGVVDLFTANASSNTATILLGKGDGTFLTSVSPAAGRNPIFAAAGDFNGDGLTDIAAANNNASALTVLLAQESVTATATATGISPLGSGTHQVDASYPGNSSYGSSVSAAVGLTAVTPPSFAVSSTAVTVAPGATTGNSSTITLTPAGGFTGSVVLTATITSSPSGAQQLPTLSFGTSSPVVLNGVASATGTLTISTITASATQCTSANPMRQGVPWSATAGTALACVLLFGFPRRRRRRRSIVGMGMLVLLFALAGGALGCSSGASGGKSCTTTAIAGTTAGTYTVTVSGTSGATTASTTLTLLVQ